MLGFYLIALYVLIGGIFPHEAQATEHLGKVVRTEDKHQLAHGTVVTVHIAHRLHIAFLADDQLLLQAVYLQPDIVYLHVEIAQIVTNSVNGTSLAGNLRIDDHEILQAFLDILLRGGQFALLFLDVLLYLFALLLQIIDGYRLVGTLRVLDGLGFLGGLSLGASLLGDRRLLSGSLLSLLLLGRGGQRRNSKEV